ncbi:C39 family peptidase [Bacteroides sp. 224]|uniref:C39 family peptidase n=1 Tax=Bacteroides sp. 224 TaxID=2302936 RepID=UPI0013D22ABB|nr:C39 family peptidase [Bacteroides sp. 224]NDV65448.1 hypothetical protein [Bacteroides sp. 224]
MKYLIIIMFFFSSFSLNAQTKKELLKEKDRLLVEISKAKWRNLKLEGSIGVSPKGIEEIRNVINQISDESIKAEFYRDLQRDVEYKNQLANNADKESSCNVTSLSEVFAFMGIDKSPDDLNNTIKARNALIAYKNAKTETQKQTVLKELNKYQICNNESVEDCLKEQQQNIQKGKLNKLRPNTRKILAEENGIKQESVFYPIQLDKNNNKKQIEDEFQSAKKIDKQLDKGNAVIISVGGHLVRVVDVKKDKNGNPTEFIVNDPFGEQMDFVTRKNYIERGYTKTLTEVNKIDSKIKTLEKKNITKAEQGVLENLKIERNKLADNGYGCLVGQSCERKNDMNNKSQKGRLDNWSIQELKDSGIGISYYETYSSAPKK